jgi:stage V sporulation protein G
MNVGPTKRKGDFMDHLKDLEVAKLYELESDNGLLAFVDVIFFKTILIKGIRIVSGKNGLFVGMPRERASNGKWYDRVMPVSQEARQVISDYILSVYNERTEKSKVLN